MRQSIYLLVFAIFTSSLATVVKYKDCGSNEGKPSEVSVSPCPEQPCILTKGTNATIDIMFTPSKEIKTVTVKLVGIIGTFDIPFPLPHPHACSYPKSQLVCPLKEGEMQHFHLELPVREEYPSLKLEAKVSLIDGKMNTIICVELPLQIKDHR